MQWIIELIVAILLGLWYAKINIRENELKKQIEGVVVDAVIVDVYEPTEAVKDRYRWLVRFTDTEGELQTLCIFAPGPAKKGSHCKVRVFPDDPEFSRLEIE